MHKKCMRLSDKDGDASSRAQLTAPTPPLATRPELLPGRTSPARALLLPMPRLCPFLALALSSHHDRPCPVRSSNTPAPASECRAAHFAFAALPICGTTYGTPLAPLPTRVYGAVACRAVREVVERANRHSSPVSILLCLLGVRLSCHVARQRDSARARSRAHS